MRCASWNDTRVLVCTSRSRSLLEGKTGVAQITRFDASDFPTTFAAQIKDFDNEGCVLRGKKYTVVSL